MRAPVAQEAAGGLTQKILYFHAPAAYAMYLCGAVCCLASALYLYSPTDARDPAWTHASDNMSAPPARIGTARDRACVAAARRRRR